MDITKEAIQRLREAAQKLFKVQIIDEVEQRNLLQLEKSMSKAKGSKDARDIVAAYLHRVKIPLKTEIKIDAGTWRAYVFYLESINLLITYKTHFLTNFGRMFTGKDEEGTGLNKVLADWCVDNFVDALVIVRPDKTTHYVMVKELMDYAGAHNTVRAFRGMEELHIPITMLNPFPPPQLRGAE